METTPGTSTTNNLHERVQTGTNYYIKWYPDTVCTDYGDEIKAQHWTSIKQENRLFSLTIYGKIIFATFNLSESISIVCFILITGLYPSIQ
jgi:hypothetical protein